LGTQIITSQYERGEGHLPEKVQASVVPLTNDEAFSLFMFDDYSEKFSFNSGCGLMGSASVAIDQSDVATWEQFLPNAPP
jgi:hypothetical protein